MTTATKLLLSVEEAAELLGLSRTTVYDLLRTRTLTSVRIGRCRRIALHALQEYIDRLPAETVDPITWARKVS